MVDRYDFAVIGAGFFGVRLALLLAARGARVALIDREHHICSRGTYANQARVHNGYHYLRSYSTALGSHRNYDRFVQEMSDCVDGEFEHVYALSRHGSYTNAAQFQRFCRELGLPLRRAPARLRTLFSPSRIEDLFVVREAAFNALAIRQKLRRELSGTPAINLMLDTECRSTHMQSGHIELVTSRGVLHAGGLFIVAYADVNWFLRRSGLALLDLKAELAEICLVDVPNSLARTAITIMDGPFFSLMPMPAEGLHSFSHVRFTPHVSWNLKTYDCASQEALSAYRKVSRFPYMQKDAQRYVPELAGLRYYKSLFEVKAIPSKHELDDGRPIVFQRHCDDPVCVSILGSKIDSVFELERTVALFLDGQLAKCVVS